MLCWTIMSLIKYTQGKSTLNDIALHLEACNDLFSPPLSSYVNISTYAHKIHRNSELFEAWDNGELIGLVACYMNDPDNERAFITNVSVFKEYQGRGVAIQLLNKTISKVTGKSFNKIKLDVQVDNQIAIALYKKFGFYLSGKIGNKYSMEKIIGEPDNIFVSICCLTYNHEDYIANAIVGFLSQKTSFSFEILIHDDASTDKTAAIIREYEKKHPDIIKPIYQTENQYSKGIPISATFNWPRARGKYIAICEGDDCWTDPLKLQKQFDFLEANPLFSACFHNANIVDPSGNIIRPFHHAPKKPENRFEDIIEGWFVPTASMFFRNYPDLLTEINKFTQYRFISGDRLLLAILANRGPIAYHHEIMSSYRKHQGGISSWGNRVKIFKSNILLFKTFRVEFDSRYHPAINRQLLRWQCRLAVATLHENKFFGYISNGTKALRYVAGWVDFKTWVKMFIFRRN